MTTDFENESVFWTRKMNLKLVEFIKSKPHMWNPKHPKYTSTDMKEKTYSEFASQYGNQFTSQAVKKRWTNIRCSFACYVRKLRSSTARGKEYSVKWHLWDACQFLLKVTKNPPPSEDLSELEDVKEDSQSLSGDEDYDVDNNAQYSYTNEQSSCNGFAQELAKVFRGVQNDAFGLDNTKHGKIGRMVTKQLSQMNSYDAARVSQQIMEVLLKYNDNNPMNIEYKEEN
ncbi:uncharacterized protein LOC105398190 [Plutella xylostella]|nr:uncharacterized protein LOC105398190 [Plutella xylostella]